MNGRGRTGHVVDLVHLHIERERDVVAHDLEMRIADQVGDVVLAAGEVVVHAQHVAAVAQQAFAQVGADETSATGDQNTFTGKAHGC